MRFLAFTILMFLYSSLVEADDSTFSCKDLSSGITLLLSATSIIFKNPDGRFEEPINASFGYAPDGTTAVWTDDEGGKLVLAKSQIFFLNPDSSVRGKFICE